jgi:DNA-binding SARP family transcriptional activator
MPALTSGRAHVDRRAPREVGRGHHVSSPIFDHHMIRWSIAGRLPTVLASATSAATTRAMRAQSVPFRILGSLEIDGFSGRIEVRRQKQKALLIALLLRAGDVVSSDQLVEDLWGDSPPRHAIGSLQNMISALRRTFGARLLTTKAPGYVLDLDPDLVDAHRFVRLIDNAREASPAAKPGLLRAALSLWRGRALFDVAFEPFADLAASRLEATRQEAREELIDAELQIGRHLALVGEIEELVADQPFRERPRSQLMLALYRSGRQADALAAFRETRRFLREQLGVEPSPSLGALHRAILRQEPALDPPTGWAIS